MELIKIDALLKDAKLKTELDFFSFVRNYCDKNKIDCATFSTVGKEYMGTNIVYHTSKDWESKYVYFYTKKVTQEQANEKLTKIIKGKYINKQDLIVIYQDFFGLIECKFYDYKTHKYKSILGKAKESREYLHKLVKIYQTL